MLLQFSRRTTSDIPSSGRTNNNKEKTETEHQQYSSEVLDNFDELISQGDVLVRQMQRPDFHAGQMGQDVRQWLDIVDSNVWRVAPKHASYILAEQGDVTHDEKLRYEGWNWGPASLRISVDRRLSRLREIRSQIKVTDLEIEHKDVLQHIVIDPRSHLELSIYRGRAGWPVIYPVRIFNTSLEGFEIISYEVNVFWDGRPVQKVIWQAPSRDASNGITVCPPYDSQEPLPAITVPPNHHDFHLNVPVNVGQIANRPAESPFWTANGNITFRYEHTTELKTFNFNTDNYQLTHADWSLLGQHIC